MLIEILVLKIKLLFVRSFCPFRMPLSTQFTVLISDSQSYTVGPKKQVQPKKTHKN